MKFSKESLIDCLEEVEPFVAPHKKEVSCVKYGINPMWEAYDQLEAAGMVHTYMIRDEDVLVGYAVFILVPSLHYAGKWIAGSDSIYIQPEYRKGHLAIQFLRWAVDDLKDEGADLITIAMSDKKSFEPITKRLGFEIMEHTYVKQVGDYCE